MVINEFMRARKWKGVMVWQGIAATSKILQSEKFCGWWSEGRTRKIGHLATQKKLAVQKKKERHQDAASKSLPPTQFGAKTQNLKSVKMIINYGG
jgi:hypothetical protein